jgi:SAM-dependent methyltransferase
MAPLGYVRYPLILSSIETLKARSIIEFGCGDAGLGVRLARRYDYLGIEPDHVSGRLAQQRLAPLGARVIIDDGRSVLGRSRADVVCAFEVLEHVEDESACLRLWSSFLNPGGHLVLSVPSHPEHWSAADDAYGHLRRYTPHQLIDRLEENHLSLVSCRYYGWPIGRVIELAGGVAGKRLLRQVEALSPAERTTRTGLGPQSHFAATVMEMACRPFQRLQVRMPSRGVGLLAVAVGNSTD